MVSLPTANRKTGGYCFSRLAPRVDILENVESFIIKAEIPEANKEDVKITVDNGTLTIRGERKQETEETGKKLHRIERHNGVFSRSFTLPDNVDETKIKASFRDEMLNVQILKTERSNHRPLKLRLREREQTFSPLLI